MSELEIVGRLALAALLGGLLGIERELDGQDAGFRTHLLLGVGAALFGAVSVAGFDEFLGESGRSNVSVDPTRVASYVAAGIGFLGGGAIVKHAGAVHGMTTAASIWATAAVGLSAGVGFWVGAVVTTAFALFALRALKPLSRRLHDRAAPATLTVMVAGDQVASAVMEAIATLEEAVREVGIGAPTPSGTREVRIAFASADRSVAAAALRRIETELGPAIRSATVET